jgi:hypothetical protein
MIVPVVPPPPPSPRAQELGHRLAQVVRDYTVEQPRVSGRDVQQAFMVARQQLRPEMGGSRATVALVVALMVLLLGLLVAFFVGRGGGAATGSPTIWMIIVGIGLVAVVAIKLSRRC